MKYNRKPPRVMYVIAGGVHPDAKRSALSYFHLPFSDRCILSFFCDIANQPSSLIGGHVPTYR